MIQKTIKKKKRLTKPNLKRSKNQIRSNIHPKLFKKALSGLFKNLKYFDK